MFFQRKANIYRVALLQLLLASSAAWAATGGSISGFVTDPTGAFIQSATLTLVSDSQRTTYRGLTDKQGMYAFPNLPVGHYSLMAAATGFATQRRINLSVDSDSVLRIDITLDMGAQSESISVSSDTGTRVDTIATHLGEVVSAAQMTAIPLNGRNYTDLLAIQPGVAPISTSLPSSIIMAGVTGSIDPSGDANPGNLSINGQRESSNGFMVNGIDVQEHMNGGTSIIPNLDSIEQFRVLSNNFDPEYGNYNGGMVTVISKSGSNSFHGNVFEFFRNTTLDARGYFDPTKAAFNQNQLGGTISGPIKHDKVFFFADYQGTRTTQGIETGNITVPTLAERRGDFSADAADFGAKGTDPTTGQPVIFANILSGSKFGSYLSPGLGFMPGGGTPYYFQAGWEVPSGDTYGRQLAGCNPHADTPCVYANTCASTSQCILGPNLNIPQAVFSAPAQHLLQYIPAPNSSYDTFSSAANPQTVRDDKGSTRIDINNGMGQISAYYFVDDYTLDNPYPGSVAGASIPGFDALYFGRAQLYSLGDTKVFGADTVNELHLGYLRNANVIGQPRGGLGVSMAAQGFSTGPDGIYVQAPQFEGVENMTFPTFVMGVPITNITQVNNTFFTGDGLSRVIRSHTLKIGAQFHADQVNEHPNATFNGTFNIDGTETGSPYADFLLGIASNFTQSSGQPFYLRNRYLGLYAQDTWRASSNLTFNAGLRWDVIMPWWEKHNQLQTWVAGAQSTLYPGAPPGLLVAGDPGVPRTIAPTRYGNFTPRLGLAYAPSFAGGIGRKIFGSSGQSSIRASYGIFYTAFPGLAAGIMYAVPPFGYNYLSPAPPLLATPFINAGDGTNNGQRFPFLFPSHRVSAANPDNAVQWANFAPLSADPFFDRRNRVPFIADYMLSIQRQLSNKAVLTVSYVGNQGHRELALVSANPGNAALCLSLASVGCGPFGEDNTYVSTNGQTYLGTRVGQSGGPLLAPGTENYGENTADRSIANSNYNALESTLRYDHNSSQFLLSYTYAKSIDQGSSLGEQLNPFDARRSRTISAWDIKHDLVASYTLALPIAGFTDRFGHAPDLLTSGWSLSGTTRFASGLPVTLFDNSDNSLVGTLGNGANNYLLDTPQFVDGPLRINTNGRNGKPAFNTALFQEENPGQLGNAKRRMFYGPGIENFDLTLQKNMPLNEGRSVDLRIEGFNVFNHTQFYGPAAVDGQIEDSNFGRIVSAAAPRLLQVAAKVSF